MTAYESISNFSQMTGLLYFFGMFVAVLVYALWPRNKKKFDEASTIPLRED
ncbi:MAG: cbb3-type cytochrome c oxidase subunit 3 [Beijerinckiaceae bacterium]|jgi:cytochrome c oxidase cbb3-type subunit 4